MELALRCVLCMYLRTTSDFCFTQYKQIDFVGMFANYEERLLVSSCLSVRMEQFGFHGAHCPAIWYWSIFRKSAEKIQASLKSDKNNGYFT
jgi:hypothetical protein